MKTITLSKGGTAERTIPVSHIVVPDLWHIGKHIEKEYPESGEAILECWRLCHDLRKEVQGFNDTEQDPERSRLKAAMEKALNWLDMNAPGRAREELLEALKQ